VATMMTIEPQAAATRNGSAGLDEDIAASAAAGRECAVHAGGVVVHTGCTRGEHGGGDSRRAWRARGHIAVGGGPWRGAGARPGRPGEAGR